MRKNDEKRLKSAKAEKGKGRRGTVPFWSVFDKKEQKIAGNEHFRRFLSVGILADPAIFVCGVLADPAIFCLWGLADPAVFACGGFGQKRMFFQKSGLFCEKNGLF